MDKEIQQKPDRSITKPGTLVTPESDDHEYKSLQQLNQKQDPNFKFVSEICSKIGKDWEKEFNAMLNSKGGTVHFGITDDCLVEEGIPLTMKDQDQIRIRVSQSFEKFCPADFQSSPFSIYFIDMENGLFRFDVDIERKSSLDTVFMSREKTTAYWRTGGRCAQIPAEAIRGGTQISKTLEDPDRHEMNTDTNTESSVDETKVSIQHLSLLCIKLQELNADWEQFGSMLHVKFDTLQQIKSNPERLSVRNKMTSVLNEWKKAKGAKNWRVIYDAVKKLNNNALAERIQQLHDLDSTVGTDKEDYIDNMLKTLGEVIPQYNQFGLHLGLHPNVLQEIEGGRLTAEECMKQLIVTWIREKGDKATINEIIKACRRMNHGLAEKLENDSEIKKTFGMNGGTHQVQSDIQEQVSTESSDDRKQVKTKDTSDDSSPMEMSHNHFEEDVDDGSVQNTVEEEIQENDNNQTTDDGVRRRTRPISENNTPSPAAAVEFYNENRLTGKTRLSLPFIWAKEHPWVTSIIILTPMVLCGVVWVILVIYKMYSGK